MTKKQYNQPTIRVANYKPLMTLCTSGTYGGESSNAGNGGETIVLP